MVLKQLVIYLLKFRLKIYINLYSITLMIDSAVVQSGAPLAKVIQGVKKFTDKEHSGCYWRYKQFGTEWSWEDIG